MKKTLLLAAGLLALGSVNAQTYLEDDWTGGNLTSNNAWTTQTDNVSYDWVGSELGSPGNPYARMSNYTNPDNFAVTSWLITPVMNLSAATTPVLTFKNAYNFAGDALEMYVSTDYTGGDPGTMGTWTDLTSSVTWSGGSFSWVGSGDVDLTTYISATTYIAFKYTGTATDGSTWEIDDFLVKEGATVSVLTPIYDIQYTTDVSGDSPLDGQEVTTKGVVTGVYQFGTNEDRFFIQDGDGAWNGIYVYENGTAVAVGDSVKVTGTVDEYFTLTELVSVSNVTILNSGNTLPTPVSVTNAQAVEEQYEGVMVTLEDGVALTAADQYGAWTINDGSNPVIKVDDDLLPATFDPVVGNGYDVTGIKHYAFDEDLILPSSSAQIVTVEYATIVDNKLNFDIYPNPATDIITLNVDSNALVAIYSMTGAVVSEGVSTKTIDVSDLDSGIYNVVVTLNGTQTAQKLIIR